MDDQCSSEIYEIKKIEYTNSFAKPPIFMKKMKSKKDSKFAGTK